MCTNDSYRPCRDQATSDIFFGYHHAWLSQVGFSCVAEHFGQDVEHHGSLAWPLIRISDIELLHPNGVDHGAHGRLATQQHLAADAQTGQLMSCPQHKGDLILPAHLGHLATSTLLPSGRTRWSSTKGSLHLAQLVRTDIPHLTHAYRAMVNSLIEEFSLTAKPVGRRKSRIPLRRARPRRACGAWRSHAAALADARESFR